MSVHKITFEDGLRLDGVRVEGITKYELDGQAGEFSTLKLELCVDDSELFKKRRNCRLDGNSNSKDC